MAYGERYVESWSLDSATHVLFYDRGLLQEIMHAAGD